MRGIGEAFQRSVKHQRDPHQHDGQCHDGDGRAKQDFRKSLELIFGLSFDLRRSAARDEDDAARRFFRVRVDAGDEIFGVGHDYFASFGRC